LADSENTEMNITPVVPYHACRNVLGENAWVRLSASHADALSSGSLSAVLTRVIEDYIPAFIPELARLEETCASIAEKKNSLPETVDQINVNPTLQILELSWKHLTEFLNRSRDHDHIRPINARECVLIWYDPRADRVQARPATDEDLLALKIVIEEIKPENIAAEGSLPIGAIEQTFQRALACGLMLAPPSRIRRNEAIYHSTKYIPEQYLSSSFFTLQWHITQACDLSCKHCYDRSNRQTIAYDKAIHILDDMRTFCRSKNVEGGVSFTGGNPLLHPDFPKIYRAAAERGFSTAILGNPTPRKQIRELVDIQMPSFFQISLEGLQEHNDAIRGPGHFERVLEFLRLLKELAVPSMVMLTLTSTNIDQALPLADILRGKTEIFHFNRLSLVGEGVNLRLPDKEKFCSFLKLYLHEAEANPVLGIKDNLINILRFNQDIAPFGGCTGYGCGAAFNFVSLLADGEVHACRKFPSRLGNIAQLTLAEIYDSEQALRYRSGSAACRSCKILPVCGGCLASAYSHGLNIFEDKDPFCFMEVC
jgi:selenobiotic family peptide radical SAM maturase